MEQYAEKGSYLPLEEALHYITEMYMEQCGISIGLRTVIYESGEELFNLLLEDDIWEERIGEDDNLFMAMRHFHANYTKSYERFDITDLPYDDCEACCDMVIDEQCSSIDPERQIAIPYESNNCELRLQAFWRGAALMLGRKKELEDKYNGAEKSEK